MNETENKMSIEFLKTIATANTTTGNKLDADEMITIFHCHERRGDLFKVIEWAFK